MIDVYKTVKIKLEKVRDVQQFVRTASKYSNLDLHSGRYIIPASSLMGIFSLNLEETIKLSYSEDMEEDIRKDFSKWIVEG